MSLPKGYSYIQISQKFCSRKEQTTTAQTQESNGSSLKQTNGPDNDTSSVQKAVKAQDNKESCNIQDSQVCQPNKGKIIPYSFDETRNKPIKSQTKPSSGHPLTVGFVESDNRLKV